MAHKNFQSDNVKKSKDRYDIYDSNFESPLQGNNVSFIEENFDKWMEFVSFLKFYPDYYYDLIKPKNGKKFKFDVDQRVMMRVLSRFPQNYMCIPRGGSKCVSGDSLLFTDKGIMEIGELFDYSKPNSEIKCELDINMANRHGKLEKSIAGISNGKQETNIIKTEEGYEIESTNPHPLLIINKNGDLVWKKSEDIVEGDYLSMQRNSNIWGNNTNIDIDMDSWFNSKNNHQKHQIKTFEHPKILTKELALILGYLIGDGCLTRKNQIILTNIDVDIINNFVEYFNSIGLEVKNKGINYNVFGTYVREYFKQLGLNISDSFGKEVPKIIMSAPEEYVSEFLKGLFDTDGMVSEKRVSFCTSSEKLSKQVQMLLLNMGIISRRVRRQDKKYKTYHYIVDISSNNIDIYREKIGFSCKRKQKRLENSCNVKRNTNKDIIPYLNDRIKEAIPKGELRDSLYHVLKGSNGVTYNKLKLIVENKESFRNLSEYTFNHFEELYNENLYFSKVETIEKSENYVYDVHMPDTNSFIANGIINHNTFIHIMDAYHTCQFFPGITMSVLASTKQSAVEIWEDKHNEILTFFPSLGDCIKTANFSKDRGRVEFVNGSIIDNLANNQQSKGKRRRRGGVEEDALVDKDTFDDAIAPIFNVPRKTVTGDEDPEELNGQINRFTTSGYKNSDAYETILQHVKDMIDLNGSFVYTSDWRIPVHFGRQKMSVINSARKGSSTRYKQNYLCDWVGNTDGALINISKLMKARTLSKLEFSYNEAKGKKEKILPEYVIGVDVARKVNNRTAIVVGKIIRSNSGRIRQIHIVNIFTPPYNLNYKDQSIIIKNIYLRYGGDKNDISKSRVKAVVIDANSWGQGLVEKLLEDTTDPSTNDELGCWDTINTDDKPDAKKSIKILYALTSQGINSDIIRNFVDCFESNKVKLITTYEDLKGKIKSVVEADLAEELCKQTVDFIDEVANLKVKENNAQKKNIVIQQNTKSIDKDRYSAMAYMLYYITMFLDKEDKEDLDWSKYVIIANSKKTESYY